MSIRKKPIQQGRRPSTGAASRIYSRDNVDRYSERARQRRRSKRVRRGVLVGVMGVLVAAVLAGGMWLTSIVSRLNDSNIITDALNRVLVDSDVATEPFYMLLLGTDGRNEDEVDRSDSIILARVDAPAKQVTLISIPRDTRVMIDGSYTKINSAFAYGGAEKMVEAVNELCGIEISHYAEISFEGMKALVDAVGGIDIYVPDGDGVDDPQAGPVVIEPGQQHMDGEAALTFCRARHQYTDGDYTRMRHQRMVLGALADQILNKLDASNIVPLVESVANMVVTDLNVSDIVSLVNAMRGMDTNNIWSANIPSWAGADTTIDGVSYVFVKEDKLAKMMERVNAGEDPQGPQSMGESTGSTTLGDLANNSSDDWASGTATTSSSSSGDEESSAE